MFSVDNKTSLELEFNDWFGKFISADGKGHEAIKIEDITDEVLDTIVAITDWEQDTVFNTNQWNVVYWYCLRLLYLYNKTYLNSDRPYYYLDDIYDFLIDIIPFKGNNYDVDCPLYDSYLSFK